MIVYDELVKALRKTSMDFGELDHVSVLLLKAANAIEELRKAVLRLEDESGIYDELPTFYIYPTKWIPVTERLPEDYELVLTCDDRQNIHMMSHTKKYKYPFGISPDHPRYFMVKYWMPLPEPPKDGE